MTTGWYRPRSILRKYHDSCLGTEERDPILTTVWTATMSWSERVWDGDKPNDWVDHYHAFNEIDTWERYRGLPMSDRLRPCDRFGVPKFMLLKSPRTGHPCFDEQRYMYMQSEQTRGKCYTQDEIAERYPLAMGGLSRAYTTDISGVQQMLQDFQSGGFGEVPNLQEGGCITVCLSYHWYTGETSAFASSSNPSKSGTSRFSTKTLEQLSFFISHMSRLYESVRIWCDFILKKRGIVEKPWEDRGLMPYVIWPTLYVSSQATTPEHAEHESFNRIWVRIEQFCCTYGRGAFMMSFDLGMFLYKQMQMTTETRRRELDKQNKQRTPETKRREWYERMTPWTREREDSSIMHKTQGLIQGRYCGVDETLCLLIRALEYGAFDECFFGRWKSYIDDKLMRWGEREEKRMREEGSIAMRPFIFPDNILGTTPPATTLITGVFKSEKFEGVKSLLPPRVNTMEEAWETLEDSSFEYATVVSFKCKYSLRSTKRILTIDEVRCEEDEEDIGVPYVKYVIITRPESGYGNCWMCEVLCGQKYHPQGHLNRIVHYVSSNGKNFPKSGIRSEETVKYYMWFPEAEDVIKKIVGKDPGAPHRKSMLETVTGLPDWDGYGGV